MLQDNAADTIVVFVTILTINQFTFDYRKAFDTVPHKRLLEKIRGLGLGNVISTWIGDFLQGRKMKVCVRGSYSVWIDVISNVPQGSVLGPLLFLIFVQDLPDWVKNSIKMFADDTKIAVRTMQTPSSTI